MNSISNKYLILIWKPSTFFTAWNLLDHFRLVTLKWYFYHLYNSDFCLVNVWLSFVEVGNRYVLCFQAYLSLPKGFASGAGLIAMMTDHYSNLVRLGRFVEFHMYLNSGVRFWVMLKMVATLFYPKFWESKLVIGSQSSLLQSMNIKTQQRFRSFPICSFKCADSFHWSITRLK